MPQNADSCRDQLIRQLVDQAAIEHARAVRAEEELARHGIAIPLPPSADDISDH